MLPLNRRVERRSPNHYFVGERKCDISCVKTNDVNRNDGFFAHQFGKYPIYNFSATGFVSDFHIVFIIGFFVIELHGQLTVY